jgi:hypothetical protein
MTTPGLNLPGNLDLDGIVALLKQARDTGKSVLDALREAVRSNPQLQGLLDQVQKLFGKPVIELTDEEFTNLIASWHQGLTAKSKPMPSDDPPFPPPPPPPPSGAGFPYMEVLTVHPLAHNLASLLKRGNEMFTTSVPIGEQQGPHYMVWNRVADKPNPIWPPPGGWSPIGVI